MWRFSLPPRAFWVGFLGAGAAIVLIVAGLVLYHLWTDHTALHVMLDYLNQHAAKINTLP